MRELDTPRLRLGRIGRSACAAVLLGVILGVLSAASAPLAVLVAASCVCYPALLFALGAFALEDIRVVLKRGATV